MADGQQKITLVFSLDEVNAVLNLLSELPYAKAIGPIQAIQMQAIPQVAQEETKAEEDQPKE